MATVTIRIRIGIGIRPAGPRTNRIPIPLNRHALGTHNLPSRHELGDPIPLSRHELGNPNPLSRHELGIHTPLRRDMHPNPRPAAPSRTLASTIR